MLCALRPPAGRRAKYLSCRPLKVHPQAFLRAAAACGDRIITLWKERPFICADSRAAALEVRANAITPPAGRSRRCTSRDKPRRAFHIFFTYCLSKVRKSISREASAWEGIFCGFTATITWLSS